MTESTKTDLNGLVFLHAKAIKKLMRVVICGCGAGERQLWVFFIKLQPITTFLVHAKALSG